MKKRIIAILAAASALSLCSCSLSEPKDQISSDTSGKSFSKSDIDLDICELSPKIYLMDESDDYMEFFHVYSTSKYKILDKVVDEIYYKKSAGYSSSDFSSSLEDWDLEKLDGSIDISETQDYVVVKITADKLRNNWKSAVEAGLITADDPENDYIDGENFKVNGKEISQSDYYSMTTITNPVDFTPDPVGSTPDPVESTPETEPFSYPDSAVEFDSHMYCFFDSSLSWMEAEYFCEELGGHLVTINSEAEQAFVESLTSSSSKNNIWIGGYFYEGAWMWVDDSPFDYQNWDTDQPDNYDGSEYYIRYANSDQVFEFWEAHKGKWNDCGNYASGDESDAPLSSFGFVCEW